MLLWWVFRSARSPPALSRRAGEAQHSATKPELSPVSQPQLFVFSQQAPVLHTTETPVSWLLPPRRDGAADGCFTVSSDRGRFVLIVCPCPLWKHYLVHLCHANLKTTWLGVRIVQKMRVSVLLTRIFWTILGGFTKKNNNLLIPFATDSSFWCCWWCLTFQLAEDPVPVPPVSTVLCLFYQFSELWQIVAAYCCNKRIIIVQSVWSEITNCTTQEMVI